MSTCQCGDVNFVKLTDFDSFGITLGCIIFKKCGLINCSPRIAENSLKEYYKNFYHPIHFGVIDFDKKESLYKKGTGKKIWNKLSKYLPKKDKIRILEIWTGTGNVLKEIKEEGERSKKTIIELGADFNEACIKKSLQNNVNTIFGDITTVL